MPVRKKHVVPGLSFSEPNVWPTSGGEGERGCFCRGPFVLGSDNLQFARREYKQFFIFKEQFAFFVFLKSLFCIFFSLTVFGMAACHSSLLGIILHNTNLHYFDVYHFLEICLVFALLFFNQSNFPILFFNIFFLFYTVQLFQ